MTSVAVLDDQAGTLEYDGDDWSSLQTDNQAVRDGTLSMLTGLGNVSTVFFGSQISVYGTVSAVRKGVTPTPVTSVYLVDNVVLGSYTAPNGTAEVDGVLFWASDTLDVNQHIVTVQITSVSPDYPFYFDYFLFVPAPTTGTSNLLETPSSSSVTVSSPTSLSNKLSLAPPSTSSTPSATTSASHPPAQSDIMTATRRNTGAIAGGVVGGVVGLFAILCALFFWWRRSRKGFPQDIDEPGDSPIEEPDVGGITGVTPYMLPRDYNSSSASVVPPETAGPLIAGVSNAPVMSTAQTKLGLASSPLAAPSLRPSEGSGSQQRLLRPDPNMASSGQDSGSVPSRGVVGPTQQDNYTDGDGNNGNHPPGRSLNRSQAPGPPSPPRRQPAVHADSGLRFPGGQLPLELMPQAPSEFPPAYTT